MEIDSAADEILGILHVFPDRHWCLIQTRPRNEKWTFRALVAEQRIVYLPLLTKVEVHNRSRRETLLPMFPGYLFACLDRDERSAVGANRCVWRVQTLSEVEEMSLIRDLKIVRMCELQSAEHELVINPGLQSGDMVRIKSGAFKGQDAIVIRRVDALSVIINLDFLGRSVDMRWNAADLVY
jgi:transcription antitermination factor NusG